MAFQFGAIKVTQKISNQSIQKFDSLLKENFKPNEKYILVLTDSIYDKHYVNLLAKDIEKAGIQSYNIVSAITVKQLKNDSTEELLTLESNWRSYLTFNDVRAHAIIALGATCRIMNKSADVIWQDFIDDKFNPSRYFCGSQFVNGPDLWVYPAADCEHLYPIKGGSNPSNWTTKFFRAQLIKILNDNMGLDSLDMRDYKIHVATNQDDANNYLRLLVNSELIAVDTETNGFNPWINDLGYIQLSNDGENAYVFDWTLINKRLLKQIFITAKRLTFANAKFDMKFLWKNGITGWEFTDDVGLLSHAINSNRTKGLKSLAIFYCGKFVGYDLKLDETRKRLKINNYLQIPKEIMEEYAGLDPIVTWRVQKALDDHVRWLDKNIPNEKVPEWIIERWYKDVMVPNANIVAKVEFEGVYFNKEQFDKSEEAIVEKINDCKKKLSKLWNIDETFEFESTKKLGNLFQKMGWPCIETAKSGEYKTSDEVLTEYERLKKPGIKEMKDLRSYNVALNTFIKGWKEFLIQHPDGSWRIHPNCNVFGTESYRHAMKNPNFQQIPSGSVIASLIKKLFTIPPNITDEIGSDWLLVDCDFTSLQMILAFADCGLNKKGIDQIAYDIYGETGHQDAHSATAFNTFCFPTHLPIIEIEDENGKKIFFGEDQKIKIKRLGLIDDDEEKVIKGKEFQCDDIFLEYA